MYLVTGITGQTGSATANALLAAGHPVRALVRDPARASEWGVRGVELVPGVVNDSDAVARALAGVEAAYVMVPPAPTSPDPIGWYAEVADAVRRAADTAGVPRLVLLSSEGAHLPAGTGPVRGLHAAEQILRGGRSRTTLLRPAYFQENWRAFLASAANDGVLPSLLTNVDRKRPMVATIDIGRTAAALLTSPDAPELVELAGAEDVSPADVANAFAETLARPVQVVVPPRAGWEDLLVGAGLGPAFAALLAEMYDGINSGHMGFSGQAPLRRGATSLVDNVRSWTG